MTSGAWLPKKTANFARADSPGAHRSHGATTQLDCKWFRSGVFRTRGTHLSEGIAGPETFSP